jgi:hypothetical protein
MSKQVILSVSSDPPAFYDTATPEETSRALDIGAHVYQTVATMRASAEIREIEERRGAEIAKIKEAAETRIGNLQTQIAATHQEHQQKLSQLYETQRIQETNIRKDVQEATQRQTQLRIAAIEVDMEVLREKNNALNERKAILEAGRDQDIRIAEERTKHLLQQTLDEKERAIMRSERTLQQLQECYVRQAEELRTLADLIRKKPQQNVKTKGSDYERQRLRSPLSRETRCGVRTGR